MLCTFHIPRWQLDADHLAEEFEQHALAFVAGHAFVERHATLEGAAEDADFLAALRSAARELDEAVDFTSPDAEHLGVGQLRRHFAGHQQAHDARCPQDRIPPVDNSDEDVGRKQPLDATLSKPDARGVGLEVRAHQPDAGDVFALRFGLSDGPKAHSRAPSIVQPGTLHTGGLVRTSHRGQTVCPASLSITAPTTVAGEPSCSRVIACFITSSGTPYCNAIESRTAPSRATASSALPALAPWMKTSAGAPWEKYPTVTWNAVRCSPCTSSKVSP